jgi:hypothetical protein
MGLFEMHRFGDRTPSSSDTPDHRWLAWIQLERLHRIAWAVYVCGQASLYFNGQTGQADITHRYTMRLAHSHGIHDRKSP